MKRAILPLLTVIVMVAFCGCAAERARRAALPWRLRPADRQCQCEGQSNCDPGDQCAQPAQNFAVARSAADGDAPTGNAVRNSRPQPQARRPARSPIRITRFAVPAISWRRIRRASGRDVKVVAQLPHFGRIETHGRCHFGDSPTGNGRRSRCAAENSRRRKT